MRRSSVRQHVRAVVACPSCTATAGEPCRSYRDSWHGPARGTTLSEMHAARWAAFRAWLAEQARRRYLESLPVAGPVCADWADEVWADCAHGSCQMAAAGLLQGWERELREALA